MLVLWVATLSWLYSAGVEAQGGQNGKEIELNSQSVVRNAQYDDEYLSALHAEVPNLEKRNDDPTTTSAESPPQESQSATVTFEEATQRIKSFLDSGLYEMDFMAAVRSKLDPQEASLTSSLEGLSSMGAQVKEMLEDFDLAVENEPENLASGITDRSKLQLIHDAVTMLGPLDLDQESLESMEMSIKKELDNAVQQYLQFGLQRGLSTAESKARAFHFILDLLETGTSGGVISADIDVSTFKENLANSLKHVRNAQSLSTADLVSNDVLDLGIGEVEEFISTSSVETVKSQVEKISQSASFTESCQKLISAHFTANPTALAASSLRDYLDRIRIVLENVQNIQGEGAARLEDLEEKVQNLKMFEEAGLALLSMGYSSGGIRTTTGSLLSDVRDELANTTGTLDIKALSRLENSLKAQSLVLTQLFISPDVPEEVMILINELRPTLQQMQQRIQDMKDSIAKQQEDSQSGDQPDSEAKTDLEKEFLALRTAYVSESPDIIKNILQNRLIVESSTSAAERDPALNNLAAELNRLVHFQATLRALLSKLESHLQRDPTMTGSAEGMMEFLLAKILEIQEVLTFGVAEEAIAGRIKLLTGEAQALTSNEPTLVNPLRGEAEALSIILKTLSAVISELNGNAELADSEEAVFPYPSSLLNTIQSALEDIDVLGNKLGQELPVDSQPPGARANVTLSETLEFLSNVGIQLPSLVETIISSRFSLFPGLDGEMAIAFEASLEEARSHLSQLLLNIKLTTSHVKAYLPDPLTRDLIEHGLRMLKGTVNELQSFKIDDVYIANRVEELKTLAEALYRETHDNRELSEYILPFEYVIREVITRVGVDGASVILDACAKALAELSRLREIGGITSSDFSVNYPDTENLIQTAYDPVKALFALVTKFLHMTAVELPRVDSLVGQILAEKVYLSLSVPPSQETKDAAKEARQELIHLRHSIATFQSQIAKHVASNPLATNVLRYASDQLASTTKKIDEGLRIDVVIDDIKHRIEGLQMEHESSHGEMELLGEGLMQDLSTTLDITRMLLAEIYKFRAGDDSEEHGQASQSLLEAVNSLISDLEMTSKAVSNAFVPGSSDTWASRFDLTATLRLLRSFPVESYPRLQELVRFIIVTGLGSSNSVAEETSPQLESQLASSQKSLTSILTTGKVILAKVGIALQDKPSLMSIVSQDLHKVRLAVTIIEELNGLDLDPHAIRQRAEDLEVLAKQALSGYPESTSELATRVEAIIYLLDIVKQNVGDQGQETLSSAVTEVSESLQSTIDRLESLRSSEEGTSSSSSSGGDDETNLTTIVELTSSLLADFVKASTNDFSQLDSLLASLVQAVVVVEYGTSEQAVQTNRARSIALREELVKLQNAFIHLEGRFSGALLGENVASDELDSMRSVVYEKMKEIEEALQTGASVAALQGRLGQLELEQEAAFGKFPELVSEVKAEVAAFSSFLALVAGSLYKLNEDDSNRPVPSETLKLIHELILKVHGLGADLSDKFPDGSGSEHTSIDLSTTLKHLHTFWSDDYLQLELLAKAVIAGKLSDNLNPEAAAKLGHIAIAAKAARAHVENAIRTDPTVKDVVYLQAQNIGVVLHVIDSIIFSKLDPASIAQQANELRIAAEGVSFDVPSSVSSIKHRIEAFEYLLLTLQKTTGNKHGHDDIHDASQNALKEMHQLMFDLKIREDAHAAAASSSTPGETSETRIAGRATAAFHELLSELKDFKFDTLTMEHFGVSAIKAKIDLLACLEDEKQAEARLFLAENRVKVMEFQAQLSLLLGKIDHVTRMDPSVERHLDPWKEKLQLLKEQGELLLRATFEGESLQVRVKELEHVFEVLRTSQDRYAAYSVLGKSTSEALALQDLLADTSRISVAISSTYPAGSLDSQALRSLQGTVKVLRNNLSSLIQSMLKLKAEILPQTGANTSGEEDNAIQMPALDVATSMRGPSRAEQTRFYKQLVDSTVEAIASGEEDDKCSAYNVDISTSFGQSTCDVVDELWRNQSQEAEVVKQEIILKAREQITGQINAKDQQLVEKEAADTIQELARQLPVDITCSGQKACPFEMCCGKSGFCGFDETHCSADTCQGQCLGQEERQRAARATESQLSAHIFDSLKKLGHMIATQEQLVKRSERVLESLETRIQRAAEELEFLETLIESDVGVTTEAKGNPRNTTDGKALTADELIALGEQTEREILDSITFMSVDLGSGDVERLSGPRPNDQASDVLTSNKDTVYMHQCAI